MVKNPIVWIEKWFIDAHNNIRHTELLPRLKLVDKIFLFERKKSIKFKIKKRLKRRVKIFRRLFLQYEKSILKKLALKYKVLLITSDYLYRIDLFPGFIIVDDDDPVVSKERINFFNKKKVLCIVTVKPFDKYYLSMGLKKNIITIPNGIDFEKIKKSKPSFQKNDPKEIICGYVVPHMLLDDEAKSVGQKERSVSFLLEAFNIVWENNPNIKLWLVGHTSPLLRERVKNLPNVKLIGYIPHDEIFSVMSSFDIALFAKVVDFGGRAHIKIYEYMALKLPIVSTRLQDTEYIEEVGAGILCSTPTEFANAVLKLSKDEGLRSQLGMNGYNYIKSFDWNYLVKRYEKEVLLPVINKIKPNA